MAGRFVLTKSKQAILYRNTNQYIAEQYIDIANVNSENPIDFYPLFYIIFSRVVL